MEGHSLKNNAEGGRFLDNFNINPKTVLFIMLGFAFLIRLLISMGYYNQNDTFWYRQWAIGTQDGLFDLYVNPNVNVDYPPVYLFFLAIIGQVYRLVGGEGAHRYVQMLLMKFWPVFFDLLLGYMLYRFGRKWGEKAGLFAAGLWLFNPAALFNSSFWGQTDGLMCLLLLISFWLLYKRPVLASVMFAVAGLTKFQCLYFTPVFLFMLYYRHGLINFLKGIGAATVTVAVVFLPFMIACGKPWLFFEVYFRGSSSYPYCTLNAFNFYGVFGLNWVKESSEIFPGFTFGILNIIMLVLIIVGIILMMVFAKRKSPFVFCLLLMQCLFMFTTRMHERYQFVTLIFALGAFIVYNRKEFLNLFLMLSVVIMVNQAVPMFDWNGSGSFLGGDNYTYIMVAVSIVNLALFAYSAVVCVKFLMESEETCPLPQPNENC